jgi:hypothetical protein
MLWFFSGSVRLTTRSWGWGDEIINTVTFLNNIGFEAGELWSEGRALRALGEELNEKQGECEAPAETSIPDVADVALMK